MTNACLPRSRGQLLATLDALDVEHRPEWQPGFGGKGWTHCNQAVEAALEALEAHLPKGLLANQQAHWLDSADGRRGGWDEVSPQLAANRAEAGYPTVATFYEEPHGHILMVVPAIDGSGLHAWQAGRTNFTNLPIRFAFTEKQLEHVQYFTHD